VIRIFSEHHVRDVKSLDGLWRLETPRGDFDAWVPGVWERIPALAGYRGRAVYSKTVDIPESGNYLLKFGGVSHTARVLWDGMPIADHYNAYTAFEALLSGVEPGAHTLEVEVDDSFGERSTLHIPNDYTTYGGINRPVELHRLGEACIEQMHFYATEDGDGYVAHVQIRIRALTDVSEAKLTIGVAGRAASARLPSLAGGETAEIEVALPGCIAQPWDVRDAHLYDLTAYLTVADTCVDDLIDRVGFRRITLDGERVLLNGHPLFIKGFNRHEDHGQLGCALSEDAMLDDLHLALEAGANAIRTCHYPNDPRFLDLCDALGILVWEENHARALPHDRLASPLFAGQIRACNEEMVAQHFNHPCIWVWGVLNECESDTAFGREIYAENLNQIRALDPTRPVTFASCRHFTDVCLDLVDVVSFNIYPGWYVDEPTEVYVDRLLAWMQTAGAAGKPLIISEIGAGAIYGYHDPFGASKWSEERQAAILREQLTALTTHARLSGVYVWQFADVRVDESWAMSRPKAMNNKGVVDSYRRPKLGYVAVREIFRDR